jgi:hypothetical protein
MEKYQDQEIVEILFNEKPGPYYPGFFTLCFNAMLYKQIHPIALEFLSYDFFSILPI